MECFDIFGLEFWIGMGDAVKVWSGVGLVLLLRFGKAIGSLVVIWTAIWKAGRRP